MTAILVIVLIIAFAIFAIFILCYVGGGVGKSVRANTGGWASDPMKWPHTQKKIGDANISKSVRRRMHAR